MTVSQCELWVWLHNNNTNINKKWQILVNIMPLFEQFEKLASAHPYHFDGWVIPYTETLLY